MIFSKPILIQVFNYKLNIKKEEEEESWIQKTEAINI